MRGDGGWLRAAIPIVIAAVVLGLRMRSLTRERRLRLETLWIVPALYTAMAALTVAAAPPSPIGWACAALGLVLGALVGWQRGRTIAIRVDPETHALSQRASPAALMLLVVLVVVRMGLREAAMRHGGWHLDAAATTDALVAFALAMFTATRAEMYLRARRLVAVARA